MKLLWDAIGTEFGSRHELYEINYSGSHEEIRRYALFGAMAAGTDVRLKQFAENCMAEYDLDGWVAKDLVNTDKFSVLGRRISVRAARPGFGRLPIEQGGRHGAEIRLQSI